MPISCTYDARFLRRIISRFVRSGLAVAFLLMGLVGLLTSSAWAQLYSGSLIGVVTDPAGAVVPGAKVTLTDVGKGYAFSATTDGVGRYVLRNLPSSTYKMAVGARNFKLIRSLPAGSATSCSFSVSVSRGSEPSPRANVIESPQAFRSYRAKEDL